MATTINSRKETVSLIGSDKVQGTNVYGADDKKIGSVQRVMIDKISGKVAYAVVSFGGFLGIGGRLLSVAVAQPEIRYATRRLSYWRNRRPAQGRSEVQSCHRLELDRSRAGSRDLRLLQDAALVLNTAGVVNPGRKARVLFHTVPFPSGHRLSPADFCRLVIASSVCHRQSISDAASAICSSIHKGIKPLHVVATIGSTSCAGRTTQSRRRIYRRCWALDFRFDHNIMRLCAQPISGGANI